MLKTITLYLAGFAAAAPITPFKRREIKAYTKDITIHTSCDSVQRRILSKAFKDTYELVSFAKDYLLTNGAGDPVVKLYFGDKPESYPAAVGVYDSVLNSNKEGVLFRCDDPDKLPGYFGHWRGSNGTTETVICEASYTARLFNAAFCSNDFQLATGKPGTYWSVDLLHRLLHVPQVSGNGSVSHYAENLSEVVELAEHNSTYSPFDSDTIQYFAAHVYAAEVAKGGDACIGAISHAHGDGVLPTTSTSTSGPAESSKDCHTHEDGTQHCV